MACSSRSTVTPLESLGHPGAVEFSIPRILYYFPKSGIASVVPSHVRAGSRMPARGHPGSIAAKSERPPISSFWVRRTTDRLPRLGPRLEQAIKSEDADRAARPPVGFEVYAMIRTLIHIALITAKAVLALIATILIVPGLGIAGTLWYI